MPGVGGCLLCQQIFQAGTGEGDGAMVAIEAKLFKAQLVFYGRLPGVQAMLEAVVVSGLAAATAAGGCARHGILDFRFLIVDFGLATGGVHADRGARRELRIS